MWVKNNGMKANTNKCHLHLSETGSFEADIL